MPENTVWTGNGKWQLHLGRRELLEHGVPVPIGARAFELLEVLVQSANQLITKDALLERIWPGAMIGENALHFHISRIRKALGRDRTMLKTDSGRGYRLLGDWVVRQGSPDEAPGLIEPAAVPVQALRTNLPGTTLDLIGRATAVQQIEDILSSHRAITLTGAGGIGKTALALQIARQICGTSGGGVWLIQLASLTDPGLVPTAVASGVGLEPGCDEITAEAVARAIGDGRILLVLDNCEHVIDAAARLVEDVIRLCSRASVLATSQEPLRIAGEHVYRVPPLEVPTCHWGEPNDVLQHSAVQLFVARLQAQDPSFVMSRTNAHLIVGICQHLDGIPLAIELAAARAATLGVPYVASHLADRLGLLTSGRRTAPGRQRTLRASLDWSYELLPDAERSLLRRLAILGAGFSLEAVTGPTSGAGYRDPAVLDCFANLIAKSFVVPDRLPSNGRWALPETVRAYVLEKLVEYQDGDAAETTIPRKTLP